MGIKLGKSITGLVLIGCLAWNGHQSIDSKVNELSLINTTPSIKIHHTELKASSSLEENSTYVRPNIKTILGNIKRSLKPTVYSGSKMFDDNGVKTFSYVPFISKKSDSTIAAIVKKLTFGAKTREEEIQRILDFVTEEIQYNDSSKYTDMSKLNAYLILKSRKGNCAGKTILYASMLEQVEADYYLTYFDEHLTVAVQGDFSDDNREYFVSGGKKYFFAETTDSGYVIGKTKLEDPNRFRDIILLQKVGDNTKPYNMRLHKPLALLEKN